MTARFASSTIVRFEIQFDPVLTLAQMLRRNQDVTVAELQWFRTAIHLQIAPTAFTEIQHQRIGYSQ